MRRGIDRVVIAILVVAGLGWWQTAQAVSGTGFVISPAFQEVPVASNVPRAQFNVKLVNHNPADQNFRLSVVDFGSLDEQGGVAFLGAPTSELEHKYGLASWLVLEKDAVFVPAGQGVQLAVTVDNRASLAPGGHYGAVLATAVNDLGQPVGESVGLRQVLSSLVLLTKAGGGVPDLKLVSQKPDGGWAKLPTHIEYRFQNAGNLHAVPRGVVEVRDTFGRLVARGALNAESAVILPESFRRYKTPLMGVAAAWAPGVYRITTSYRYDGTLATKTLVTSFWYAGQIVVWLVVLMGLAAAGVLAWWSFGRPKRRRS